MYPSLAHMLGKGFTVTVADVLAFHFNGVPDEPDGEHGTVECMAAWISGWRSGKCFDLDELPGTHLGFLELIGVRPPDRLSEVEAELAQVLDWDEATARRECRVAFALAEEDYTGSQRTHTGALARGEMLRRQVIRLLRQDPGTTDEDVLALVADVAVGLRKDVEAASAEHLVVLPAPERLGFQEFQRRRIAQLEQERGQLVARQEADQAAYVQAVALLQALERMVSALADPAPA